MLDDYFEQVLLSHDNDEEGEVVATLARSPTTHPAIQWPWNQD